MADKSAIEWTDATWNPTTGCDRVSPGCANCYAVPQAKRNQAMARALGKHVAAEDPYMRDGDPRTSGPGFGLQMHRARLYLPLGWTRPRRIFVDSMSDLFHPEVTDGFLARVWDVMGRAPWHTFQILTKRPERMREWVTRWADRTGDELVTDWSRERGPDVTRARYSSGRGQLFADLQADLGAPPEGSAYPIYDWMEGQRYWPRVLPNVWLGTSVENARWRTRIDELRQTPAAVRFLSCEPLLGPLNDDGELDLDGIGWLIAGGESGPEHRPVDPDWIRQLRDECIRQGVPFLFKQWGGRTSKSGGRELDGQTWDAMPAVVA
jgi:protein gp37